MIQIIAQYGSILVGGIGWAIVWYNKISELVTPLILKAEKLGEDGSLDGADKKQLVLDGIKILEDQKLVKFNFVSKWILGIVIDKVVARIEDIIAKKKAANEAVLKAQAEIPCGQK